MARSAIPDFGIEYPAWVECPWPKYVGMTAEGEALIAKDQDEYDSLKSRAFFPKLMGRDKNGSAVIAQIPRDLEWLKASVVTSAAAVKAEEDATAHEAAEVTRKAKAYDDLMAKNALGSQTAAGVAVNASTGLKKSKAA